MIHFRDYQNKKRSYEEALIASRGLIGDAIEARINPEYTRGQVELIMDLFGYHGCADSDERKAEIMQDLALQEK